MKKIMIFFCLITCCSYTLGDEILNYDSTFAVEYAKKYYKNGGDSAIFIVNTLFAGFLKSEDINEDYKKNLQELLNKGDTNKLYELFKQKSSLGEAEGLNIMFVCNDTLTDFMPYQKVQKGDIIFADYTNTSVSDGKKEYAMIVTEKNDSIWALQRGYDRIRVTFDDTSDKGLGEINDAYGKKILFFVYRPTFYKIAGRSTLPKCEVFSKDDQPAGSLPCAWSTVPDSYKPGEITISVVNKAEKEGIPHKIVIESLSDTTRKHEFEVNEHDALLMRYGDKNPFKPGSYKITVAPLSIFDRITPSQNGTPNEKAINLDITKGEVYYCFEVERLVEDGLFRHPRIDTSKRLSDIEHGDLAEVKAIVLHQTGGSSLKSATDGWKTTKFGAHFVVEKDGQIYQTAKIDQVTWHNISDCANIRRFSMKEIEPLKKREYTMETTEIKNEINNNNSIGIEFVSMFQDDAYGYEDITTEQLEAAKFLIPFLGAVFNIGADKIYHHPELAYKKESEAYSIPKSY